MRGNHKGAGRVALLAAALLGAALMMNRAPSPKAQEEAPKTAMIIDDFTSETASISPGKAWRLVADRGTEGASSGRIDRQADAGVGMLRMTGEVVAPEGTGFVLASLELGSEAAPFDASRFGGIRLAVRGNGERYALHLKTTECERPCQYYRAEITTSSEWRVIHVPFERLKPNALESPFNASHLLSVSLAAAGRSFKADLTVGRVALYEGDPPAWRNLAPTAEAVIAHKGTERPFTGKYFKHDEEGVYACKRCGAALFGSEHKFGSDCGWPSFDDAVPGAVLQLPDADGRRTEILCFACGAHLGHVFLGEGFTDKNTRYCVNSISLEFLDASPEPEAQREHEETAIFASGCFWGTEYYLQKAPGVLRTTVGFTGGHKEKPSYREVCTGKTGHAEAVEVVFDTRETSYEALVRLFFETHDFTQVNRQGPDIGTQYRSEIFFFGEEQNNVAQALIDALSAKGHKVATHLTPATRFWPAEDYHQDYYENNGKTPYCHFRREVF